MMFPKTKFVRENSLKQQIDHIESEFLEVFNEFTPPLNDDKLTRLMDELHDLIHSSETLQRIIQERYQISIEESRQRVIHKNTVRGYYE